MTRTQIAIDGLLRAGRHLYHSTPYQLPMAVRYAERARLNALESGVDQDTINCTMTFGVRQAKNEVQHVHY